MTIVRVRIEGEDFAVEVGDVLARPVVALVDGQRFEVWPEAAPAAVAPNGAAAVKAPATASSLPAAPAPAVASPHTTVLAPLPGVVVEVSVQPGDRVSAGQALLAIEAMKMKNVVRATQAGRVTAVYVGVGQTVKHRAPLLEYALD